MTSSISAAAPRPNRTDETVPNLNDVTLRLQTTFTVAAYLNQGDQPLRNGAITDDAVLNYLDMIGGRPHTQLPFVTHYPKEIPVCSTHILSLHQSRAKVIKTTS